MKLDPRKVGLTLGAFVGFWHVVWGILVALGWASILQSWILDLHFLNNPFRVQPFDVTRWIILVIVTSIVGYIFGYFFSKLWNKISKG